MLKKYLYKHKKLLRYLLEHIDPSILVKLGNRSAISVFKDASSHVIAYQKLLKKHNIHPGKINNIDDFSKLPILDKKSYINNNILTDLLYSPIEYNYTIEESSGFSGKSSFWPRFDGQDDLFADYAELGFEKSFNISNKKTLLINTFALGTWVTGTKFAKGTLQIANRKSNKLTVVNTGIKQESVIRYLETFTQYYDQVIIAGYPPFIKEIIELAISNIPNFDIKKINIMTGGEGFPEEWRDYIASLLGYDPDLTPHRILSAYGAADIGLELGYEQPITVFFRRMLIRNPELAEDFVPHSINTIPHFFQYNPLNIYVECLNSELLYTAKSGIPAVRYNLHDSGGLLSYNKMLSVIAKKFDLSKILNRFKPFHLPLLYLLGRTDGVISVSSANVYIEQLKAILNDTKLQKQLSGRFYAYSRFDSDFKPEFHVFVETDRIATTDKEYITDYFVKRLCAINQDYKEFYTTDKKQYKPHMHFISKNVFNKYANNSIKIRYLSKK